MNKQQCYEIFSRLHAQNPHPKPELHYHSSFELLIAVMLSAQATDISVNKATAQLFPVANTAQAIWDLGEAGLKHYIKSIGLYNAKAANIIKTCRLLIDQYQGEVPKTRAALESLPGVGRKTANVILNAAFAQPTIAVDTHIFRVANRTGLAKGKTPLAVEKKLTRIIPTEFLNHAHLWLVLHGRYTCTARKPHCKVCIIQDLCQYPHKNL